jgi:(R,R)-butanediol dehydrogenase / meso-butanediol dehydrogenase / diacetyl reductase
MTVGYEATAVVYRGPQSVAVESIQIPGPGPGEMLLRIAMCGVCGSDVSEYIKGPLQAHISSEAHRITGHSGPVVLGHEFSGYVVETGPGVDFAPGTLVACAGGVACGECRFCRHGRGNLCEQYHIVGMQRHGGLSSYCTVPARACIDAGALDATPSTAALAQPMAIAVHALGRADLAADARIAVIGVGGIGAFITYAAVESGAHTTAIDIADERLTLARNLGAAAVVAAGELRGQIGPGSFDAVFEASGTTAGLETAMELAGRGGRLMLVGVHAPERGISPRRIVFDEMEVIGCVSLHPPDNLSEAVRVLSTRREGWADVAPAAFPLESVVSEGLTSEAAGRRIKSLFAPGLDQMIDTATADELLSA